MTLTLHNLHRASSTKVCNERQKANIQRKYGRGPMNLSKENLFITDDFFIFTIMAFSL